MAGPREGGVGQIGHFATNRNAFFTLQLGRPTTVKLLILFLLITSLFCLPDWLKRRVW